MIEGSDTEVNQLSLRPKLFRWVNDPFEIIRQKKDMFRLSSRKKVSAAGVLFVLLDLQLAATKHYFTIDHINLLLETFEYERQAQSHVVICMFSQIVDPHRIDVFLRSLERKAQTEIMHRLGYLDNRIVVISMMELASIESTGQIIEDSNTKLPIQTYMEPTRER